VKPTFQFKELGRLGYEEGLARQQSAHAEVVAGGQPLLMSLEHEPVYTLGRRDMPNQFIPEAETSIPVIRTDRGGEITYHGPGQAVLYVILSLERFRLTLPDLVFGIEGAIITAAAEFGISAQRKEGWRGVFAGPRKLASIGLAVHHDVTMHGLAMNVENDLAPFSQIHPCGLPIEMCSLASLGVAHPGRAAVGRRLAELLSGALRSAIE
jgi:lipoyl(octanoyl) transferase